MDIAEYNRQIQEFNNKVEKVKEYALMFDDEIVVRKLDQLAKIIKNDSFQLIVVGEFSRGKSMLVNAIIGKKILPSSKNPTTATLNIIEDGSDQPEYCVFYHDGSQKELSENEFSQLVAPDGKGIRADDINNYYAESIKLQKIHHIGIKVNNRMGKNGITIIDTPGVNDVDERREQITYNYIPNADAALIVCSATQQLSMSEMVFIKESILKNDIDKLFIVSNFKDLLSGEEDCERVKEYFASNLEGVVPRERIILVSARDALRYKRLQNGETVKKPPKSLEETGFVELETRLYDFLSNERGAIKIGRYKKILKNHIEELVYGSIDRRIQSLRLTEKEVELKIQTLRPEIQQTKMRCENRLKDIESKLIVEGRHFSKEYRELQNMLYTKARDAVRLSESEVPEEVYAFMERSIIPYEKDLFADFPERMKNRMIGLMEESLEKMGEEFGSVGVRIDFGFDFLSDSSAFEYSKSTMRNELIKQAEDYSSLSTSDVASGAAAVAGGVIGAAALLSTGGIALPFAHIGLKILTAVGGKVGTAIDNASGQTLAKRQLNRVLLAEIEKRFNYPIDGNVANFEMRYKNSVDGCLRQIRNECYEKLEQTLSELTRRLNEKITEAEDREKEIQKITKIKTELLSA